jgi:alpha-1,2-mannosyltransferase
MSQHVQQVHGANPAVPARMNQAYRPAFGRLLHSLVDGTWLTRRRLLAAATVLLLLEAALLAITIAATHGLYGQSEAAPTTTDFMSFYAAGRLAHAGRLL